MSVLFEPGPEGFLSRYEGLNARLPGHRTPWVTALREQAAKAFREQGFPTRKIEAWHYTDLNLLARSGFAEALTPVDEDVALPEATAPQRVVFLDGRFRADLAETPESGIPVRSLGANLSAAEGLLGGVAKLDEVPMAALNTMLFEDGALIDLPAGTNGGAIELLSIIQSGERPVAVHPRHVIRLGKGASLVLIERAIGRGDGRYLHNPVVEIVLEEGAHLTHARIQQEGPAGLFLSTVFAKAAAGATYDSFLLHAGAKLSRSEAYVSLDGPKAMAHLNGAQLLSDGQHGDCTTFLDHAAPDCASRQTVKTVLAGKSRGVFQGKIHVHQIAQRTDGYQMNQALLLSDQAEIDSKPQLEIYADDVKCSHGATVGELDEDQLFYLRARGIPAATARSMLIEAFLQEAVDAVEEETARNALATAVAGWWEKVA